MQRTQGMLDKVGQTCVSAREKANSRQYDMFTHMICCSHRSSPVDEGRLPGRVVPDEHDVDLLPGREQLQAEGVGDGDEAVLGVGVEAVTLLEDPLVEGRRGQVHGLVGRGAVLDAAARHLGLFTFVESEELQEGDRLDHDN